MAVYRFVDDDGQVRKFDTDKAELLLCTRWEAGRDQSRWSEIYRTAKNAYVVVHRTLWQGEHDTVYLAEEPEVLRHLALAEGRQRTEAGDALLAAHDPSIEV